MVLIKNLGLEVETMKPNEAAFQEFQQTFVELLSPSRRETTRVLFPRRS
jgi:hypothetical protein